MMKELKMNKLIENEMSEIKGGGLWSQVPAGTYIHVQCGDIPGYTSEGGFDESCCGCACAYANSGGSSIADNKAANFAG